MVFLKQKNIKGQLSMQMLIYGGLVTILLTGFLSWTSNIVTSDLKFSNRTLAFSIAQAGVEYYRWHLAHAPEDYQDDTGGPGPYTHNYYDKSNNLVGQFPAHSYYYRNTNDSLSKDIFPTNQQVFCE